MGRGKSMKETSLHHFRDPLLDVVSSDTDVNLRGIVLMGTSDAVSAKYFVSHRTATLIGGMGISGVILSCSAIGNDHVDYANVIEEIEIQGIPTAALSLCPASDFVVQNDHLCGVVNFYKNYEETAGAISTVLAEHTITQLDAKKALALLKLRMRR